MNDARIPNIWRGEFLAAGDVPGRGLCAVQRFIYTCGLIVNLRFDGLAADYDARYCYPSGRDAIAALFSWDGIGDPPGEWIKEKVSGRARTPKDAEDRCGCGHTREQHGAGPECRWCECRRFHPHG
jgi:hypothetical protein